VDATQHLTGLLVQWSRGDEQALERLLPLVYRELRRIAARQLRAERRAHSLDPTALVHELYLRLVDQRSATWQNRAQFFGLAAQLMRRILVDHARARQAAKRGGGLTVALIGDVAEPNQGAAAADIIDLDRALLALERQDADQARLVELRFFAGLTVEEAAHVLDRSPRTVKREWRLAKAWLFRELRPPPSPSA
jgi:RNA polymerase sigma-70 factor, ECF subfamily